MQNVKEIKKLIRKNPGKYASISTAEGDVFEGILLSGFFAKQVMKVASQSNHISHDFNSSDLKSFDLILKGVFLFNGTGVDFVFYEGVEIIRIYDSPMFEEDSKEMFGCFKEWLHAHS
ncbi:TPA: hypothetical protein ACXOQZ_005980 [Bacillus anthracis]